MFCDLADSTSLSQKLDPEDYREVVREYQHAAGAIVRRLEGHVAQYLGDGILVYFGYPVGHEDDATRAALAATEILAALQAIDNPHLAAIQWQLELRIAIHTGEVVVGEMGGPGRSETLALGETPNIAARLVGSAAPGKVVVSEATRMLLGRRFSTAPLGPHSLKGVADPVEAHVLVRSDAMHDRIGLADASSLSPLVGRDDALATLRASWGAASSGQGRVVYISAEAGVGKSRLVEALREEQVAQSSQWLEFRGDSHAAYSPLLPMLEAFTLEAGIRSTDLPEVRIERLEKTLREAGIDPKAAAPMLAPLLRIPTDGRYPPHALEPDEQRRRAVQALLSWLLGRTAAAPAVLVFEDAHWMDPSTLQLVGQLLPLARETATLVLVCHRPAFVPAWPSAESDIALELGALDEVGTRLLAKAVLGTSATPERLEYVVSKTDGVPFFVEEVSKSLLLGEDDSIEGARAAENATSQSEVPAILYQALVSRLDALGPYKPIIAFAAVVGREFSYALLSATQQFDEATLSAAMEELTEKEIVICRGQAPESVYLFRHALLQDVAYESLVKASRRESHKLLGETLAKHYPDVAESRPELLAQHFTEAREIPAAVGYWTKAAQLSAADSAHTEATAHYETALSLLEQHNPDGLGGPHEMMLQLGIGVGSAKTKGLAHDDAERAFSRALELSHTVSQPELRFRAVQGLSRFYGTRADLDTALDVTRTMLTIAEPQSNPAMQIEAHRANATIRYYRGEFTEAMRHLKSQRALLDEAENLHTREYGQDPVVTCNMYEALVSWKLGFPLRANGAAERAIAAAHAAGDPNDLAFALAISSVVQHLRRDHLEAKNLAESALQIATKHNYQMWRGVAIVQRGAALCHLGDVASGTQLIVGGTAAFRATGALLTCSYGLSLHGEAYARAGDYETALAAVDEGLSLVEATNERYFEAELLRQQGEYLAKLGRMEESWSGLQRSLKVARVQCARSFALRTTTTAARIFGAGEHASEVASALREVVGEMEEHGQTLDLGDARYVLSEL
jgi:class 3 adenylate cyclase/tetratricopeptide (TPR) repeat protein